ncbi:MAG: hypothetical protein M1522_06865 [Actinobacteria bacterium]|nr:hypothetical protein [Actinomycetota bacterium]
MKFEDLEVGMEVLVLRGGKRGDLATAVVSRCTVLSSERWSMSPPTAPGWGTTPIARPNGGEILVRGYASFGGKYAAVLEQNIDFTRYAELVAGERILGPADEWQAKVNAARRERDTYQRERDERLARQQALAKQVSERCGGLEQRVKSAGIAASVMSGGGARVNIVREDLATAERVVDLLTTAGGRSEVLAAEMHAALDRYHATGEMGEFIAAQKAYNDEERRLRRALHDLTGEHYQPTSGRHC